jgi:type III secretion protein Q
MTITGQAASATITAPTVSRELRLRRIAAEQAAALCHLFMDHNIAKSQDDHDITWTFSPAHSQGKSAVFLRGAHHELALNISQDGLCESLGPRQWWDYEGESRLSAWTLAHAALLETLGGFLQESLLPVRWHSTVALGEAAGVLALDFSARAGDGRTTAGVLSASPAVVAQLAASATPGTAEAAVRSWATRLEGRIDILLRTIPFPGHELLAARVGDVLVLGRRARCWRNMRVVHSPGDEAAVPWRSWSATYDGERLEICAALLDDLAEGVMPERTVDELATKSTDTLESLPVVLDFEVGTLRIPLAELALLKPGYVFQLPDRLESAHVVIRANGKRIGRGELVTVGDTLGVQLLAIDADGLR